MNNDIDLSRFTQAHRMYYDTALREIRSGRKATHWMWYIFPQIHGLGKSLPSETYAIRSLAEAEAFARDPYLGGHLREISEALLRLETNDPRIVFDVSADVKKLRSSMTLFALAEPEEPVYLRVLDKYFGGKQDGRTKKILGIRYDQERGSAGERGRE